MRGNSFKMLELSLLLFFVIGTLTWYFLSQPKEVKEKPSTPNVPTFAKYVATYTEEGVVTLYDVEKGTKLDETDLKTRAKEKEKTVEVEQATGKIEKPAPKEVPQTTISFKGFEQVPITIKKGQNVWTIQSGLTPHINTIHMIPLLKELNKGKSLHPVYPNEVRIFLRKPSGQKVEAPKEVSHEVATKTVTKKVEDSIFVYYTDKKNKVLYAYSNFTNEVYRLAIEKDKWVVSTVAQVDTKRDMDWLYVDNQRIWLADASHTQIEVFDIKKPSNVEKLTTKGEMSGWHIEGDLLHYTYQNRMTSLRLKQGEMKDVVLGDQTAEFVSANGKFYVLNTFGKKSDNSILLKVNPEDLIVEDLIDLKSNETAILSHGEEGILYLGKIEKTKGLDGEITKEPKVFSIDVTSKALKEVPMSWKLIFSESMQGWNDHLYAVEEGNQLRIYPSGAEEPVKEFEVTAPNFSLLP